MIYPIIVPIHLYLLLLIVLVTYSSCPKGTFIANLKVDHASFISEIYYFFPPQHRLGFIKNLIENCLSVGLFLETDPSQPVSWASLSNFGHISAVCTVEEHRRKGYSRVTMLYLMKQILVANMMPIALIELHNTPSSQLFTSLGFVEGFHATSTIQSI